MKEAPTSVDTWVDTRRKMVDAALERFLPSPPGVPSILSDGMRYSVMAGGKRLRPLLALAAAELVVAAKDEFSRRIDSLKQRLDAGMRAGIQRRMNAVQTLRLALEARDVRRRLAAIRGRLTAGDGRLYAAARRNRDRADARFRVLVGRLENLSPLGVLARGYAVCWNADRTAIISRASAVNPGDRVRVTLNEGELHCDVRKAE